MVADDKTANFDKFHGGEVDDTISLDSVMQLNASGVNQPLELQALESSGTVGEEASSAASNDVSMAPKQKANRSKPVKSRPTCLLCDKSFHTRYKLNEHHAVVHLDKRLFSCNVCQKTFGRADHLVRHVRNRVCVSRQHQQLLDLVDDPSHPGKYNVAYNYNYYYYYYYTCKD